jgi:hypothetical protein
LENIFCVMGQWLSGALTKEMVQYEKLDTADYCGCTRSCGGFCRKPNDEENERSTRRYGFGCGGYA